MLEYAMRWLIWREVNAVVSEEQLVKEGWVRLGNVDGSAESLRSSSSSSFSFSPPPPFPPLLSPPCDDSCTRIPP